MRLSIEHGSDPILKGSFYILKVGTRRYHYEKLADILYRIAVIFEPPEEEEKPRKVKKPAKSFHLGKAILDILPGKDTPPMTMERIVEVTTAPRTYSKSIWGAVVSRLVNRKLVICSSERTPTGAVKVYRRAK